VKLGSEGKHSSATIGSPPAIRPFRNFPNSEIPEFHNARPPLVPVGSLAETCVAGLAREADLPPSRRGLAVAGRWGSPLRAETGTEKEMPPTTSQVGANGIQIDQIHRQRCPFDFFARFLTGSVGGWR